MGSGVGPRPHLQHGREPARLVHLAPARLGRADSGGRLRDVRRGRSSRRRSSSRPPRSSSAYGADAWYERPIEEFIPAGLTCPACGGTSFEREMNILDVWFDSGSSHEAVLSVRPELTWPADMYLEGSDQHRGWFQSSLLVGLGTRGRAAVPRSGHARLHRRRRRTQDVEIARQLDRAAGHHQAERRGHPAAVGLDERLHAGSAAQQGDPRARRRGVPQDPQHAAISGREPVRLRPGGRSRAIEAASKRSIATSSRGTRDVGAADPARVRRTTTTARFSRRSTRSPRSI